MNDKYTPLSEVVCRGVEEALKQFGWLQPGLITVITEIRATGQSSHTYRYNQGRRVVFRVQTTLSPKGLAHWSGTINLVRTKPSRDTAIFLLYVTRTEDKDEIRISSVNEGTEHIYITSHPKNCSGNGADPTLFFSSTFDIPKASQPTTAN